MLEPLTLLAHLGAITSRVNIGTSVIILPYRNPVILAKAIATADVLSRGRVIFGAAVGWMEGEFNALNAPFSDRGAVSNEYLRLLKELWTNSTPDFEGGGFHISDVTFSPMRCSNRTRPSGSEDEAARAPAGPPGTGISGIRCRSRPRN